MRQIIRYALLILSFALITFGLLAWQRLDFSLASLTEFSSAGFHPVTALILGLGLLPPTLSELLTTHRNVQDRHEN
ncbi:MAG: hypothetical protein VYC16_09110 [Pseudomonadota bacterium]|nr:hypothetical protein [Pseudomonadota bacterium]